MLVLKQSTKRAKNLARFCLTLLSLDVSQFFF